MTTVEQFVERIAVLTREVRASDEPVTEKQWQGFDANLHRFLAGSIGYQGTRVPKGHPCADILRELVDRYPALPRSPLAASSLPPEVSARWPARDVTPTVGLPRRGVLRLVDQHTSHESEGVALPDATDPRPMARITCALGALADLVDLLEYQQVPSTSEFADNTAHVLAASAVVARHTLASGSLISADRPLAVGKHVEAALGAMQPALEATPVRSFRGLPTVVDVDVGDTALDRAVHAWSFASEAELRARIPSAQSLHMLVNQGTHITATFAAVVRQPVGGKAPPGAISALDEACEALGATDKAWVPRLTTLVKPSADFITASRGLFLALEEARARSHGLTEAKRERAADSLGQAMTILGRRLTAARSFLRPLADGKALYAPAGQVEKSAERLNDRLKGRFVTVKYFDIKDLDTAWRVAEDSIRQAHARLRCSPRSVPSEVAIISR
ncbi:hypothetical protein LL946_04800 [Knoellia locipacati]|uniref:hypothetical protein n=1 Tax=Knoellia locipacati TaxID=882824 RepID=UPI00384C3FD9